MYWSHLPLAACVSSDPGGHWHVERCHPAVDAAPDFRFRPLIDHSAGMEAPINDSLVAEHHGLDQASSIAA
jgi:hypothetical protein